MPFDGTEIPAATLTLMKGRAYLIEHGWCKGSFRDRAGRVCMLGALGVRVNQQRSPAAAVATSFLLKTTCGYSVLGFNDAKERTFEEVLAAYDEAIALAMKG